MNYLKKFYESFQYVETMERVLYLHIKGAGESY